MVAIPSPVALFSGLTNRPVDCRTPIVTISSAAAVMVVAHTPGPFIAWNID